MLPRKYRLSLRTELERVKATGKLVHGKLFSLLIARQQSQPKAGPPLAETINHQPSAINNYPSRFAFIVSSKVHKRAVKRNKAKRLLSEAVYSIVPKIRPGFDGVFLAKKAIIEKELTEIRDEVERVFKKAGLRMY